MVGDVVVDLDALRRNRIREPTSRRGDPAYAIRRCSRCPSSRTSRRSARSSSPTSADAIPSSRREDRSSCADLARQAVRALRNARQHEAEKKVEELDALLAVSREITSTLDLDQVMQTVVNATSALIAYDRCASRSSTEGKLRLGAVSGRPRSTGRTPTVRRTEELLQWVFLSGKDVAVTQLDDGRSPPTGPRPRRSSARSSRRRG